MDLNARMMKMQELGILGENDVVNAGIETPNAQCISWSPGDGYRYNLLFTLYPDSIN